MATDMEEVLGPELMIPEAEEKVIDFLNTLPLTRADIKAALFQWGRQAGKPTTAAGAGAVGVRKKRKA